MGRVAISNYSTIVCVCTCVCKAGIVWGLYVPESLVKDGTIPRRCWHVHTVAVLAWKRPIRTTRSPDTDQSEAPTARTPTNQNHPQPGHRPINITDCWPWWQRHLGRRRGNNNLISRRQMVGIAQYRYKLLTLHITKHYSCHTNIIWHDQKRANYVLFYYIYIHIL
jgi:hypothetical protein